MRVWLIIHALWSGAPLAFDFGAGHEEVKRVKRLLN